MALIDVAIACLNSIREVSVESSFSFDPLHLNIPGKF